MTRMARWWEAVLQDGKMGNYEPWGRKLPISVFIRQFAIDTGSKKRKMRSEFVRQFTQLASPSAQFNLISYPDGYTASAVTLPTLADCRLWFDIYSGKAHTWGVQTKRADPEILKLVR